MYSLGPQSEGEVLPQVVGTILGANGELMVFTGMPGLAGDYLGGEGYWAGGLHLYTPLPFRPGRGGFGDLFRTHFFLNAGNLCNLNYGEWGLTADPGVLEEEGLRLDICWCSSGEGPGAHLKKLAECIRWSYGLGIVLRLGNIARLELNYCIPMGVQSGDRWVRAFR